jgi:hypothetical protein
MKKLQFRLVSILRFQSRICVMAHLAYVSSPPKREPRIIRHPLDAAHAEAKTAILPWILAIPNSRRGVLMQPSLWHWRAERRKCEFCCDAPLIWFLIGLKVIKHFASIRRLQFRDQANRFRGMAS